MDFTKLGQKKNQEKPKLPKKRYKEVEEIDETKEEIKKTKPVAKKKVVEEAPKKVGRKSWKDADVTYTRIAFDTPMGSKQKLKQLLATKFFGKYISQDEMINVAIDDFIKKHL